MRNRNLLFNCFAVLLGLAVVSISAAQANAAVPGNDGDGVKAATSYFAKIRNNQITGKVNPADELRAAQQAESLNMKNGDALDVTWVERGPDNFSGRIRSVLVDNRNAEGKVMFAGSPLGGLWKSTNAGVSWNKVDASELMRVSSIFQKADGTIYVGTGENHNIADFNGVSDFIGNGIWVSTDGNAFTVLESTIPAINDLTSGWSSVNAIEASGSNLYAATLGGLMVSGDNGLTWSFAKDIDGQEINATCQDVNVGAEGVTIASVGSDVYVSVAGAAGAFEKVTYSENAGNIALAGVAACASNANILYIVAVSKDANSNGLLENVYLSEDKGATWRVVGPGGSSFFDVLGEEDKELGYYALEAQVDLEDPYKLYICSNDIWEGVKVAETGFYDWTQKVGSIDVVFDMALTSESFILATNHGVGVTGMNIPMRAYINNMQKASMFYTVDANAQNHVMGGTQGFGTLLINGQGNTNMNAIRADKLGDFPVSRNGGYCAYSEINPEAYFITSSAGAFWATNDNGASAALYDFKGQINLPNNYDAFKNPFIMWESFNNTASGDSIKFKATKDYAAGASETIHSNNNEFPFEYQFVDALPKGGSVMVQDIISNKAFYAAGARVYMSTELLHFTQDGQIDWHQIAEIEGEAQNMAYSGDANYLWIGTDEGKLYRVANIATAYDSLLCDITSDQCILERVEVASYENRVITSIAVNPMNADKVVVTLGNYGNDDYVFYSENATAETPVFESVQGNLPKMPVYSALIEMSDNGMVMVGTDRGVFAAEDVAAKSWATVSGNVGMVPVTMLKQETVKRPDAEGFASVKNHKRIYAATYGRGVFESASFIGFEEIADNTNALRNSLKVYPNPVVDNANISFTLENDANVSVQVYDLSGRMVKSENMGALKSGENNVELMMNEMNRGIYIMKVNAGSSSVTGKIVIK